MASIPASGTGRAPGDERAQDGAAVGGGARRSERPTLRPGVVARDDLVGRLRATSPASLVVVRAPAGYGKSTAVALWEQGDPRPFAWVGLDRLDDDPVHLLQHVAASVDRVSPVPDELHALLAAPGRTVADELVPALLDHLREVEPLVLVVDDVHVLGAVEAQAALTLLADGLGKEVQLVLVSRAAIPIPLARRRLDDLVLEVGAADLALDADQAGRSFAQLGVVVDPATVDDLVERSEGWAAGLHLAALATRDRRQGGPPALSGRHRLVADYLVEEVLRGLDPATTGFLEESSVLEEMEAATVDDVLERTDSRQRLRDLEASGNLLLVPLDDERERYRYHHLFGELLHDRLLARDRGRAVLLHRRSADHFEAAGDLDAAIVHTLATGDDERAAALVMREAVPLAFDGRSGVLARRLAMLGEQAAERHVDAAVATAWYGLSLVDVPLIVRSLQQANAIDDGRRLGDGTPSVAVASALIRSFLAPGGVHQVRRDAEVVVAAGDWSTNPWWGIGAVTVASVHGMIGDLTRARRLILEALPTLDRLPGLVAAARGWLALIDLAEGDLDGARTHAAEARGIADRHHLEALTLAIVAYSVDALISARSGDRSRSEAATAIADALLGRLGDAAARTALLQNVLLAQADLARGDGGAARAHAAAARRAADREPDATWPLEQLAVVEAQLDAARASTSYVTPLTDAERRVLPYLATHLSLQEVAAELHVSRNTAKTHSVAIYRKLGVSSRSEAVAEARRLGLLAD